MTLKNQEVKDTFKQFVGREFTLDANDPVMKAITDLAASFNMEVSVKHPDEPDMSFFTGNTVRFQAEYADGTETKLRVKDSFTLR